MPYRPIAYDHIQDEFLKHKVFEPADMLLSDTYGMFGLKLSSPKKTGGGNFTIALVLLCVVDGISCHVYPTSAAVREQERRFKCLINNKLPWGPKSSELWHPHEQTADLLYTEFRNPLVHELAVDKPARARPKGFQEPGISKWGNIPKQDQDIDKIDEMAAWNPDWPTLRPVTTDNGGERLDLSCAALYWAIKDMVNKLVADTTIVNAAAAVRWLVTTVARQTPAPTSLTNP